MWREGTRVPGTQTQVRSERESGCREKKSIQGEGLEWKSERVRWVHSGQQDLEGLAGAEARGGRGRLEFRAVGPFRCQGEAQHQLFGRSLWPLENGW